LQRDIEIYVIYNIEMSIDVLLLLTE